MQAVQDPGSFIKSYVHEKPVGMRHLLREMQSRKRENNNNNVSFNEMINKKAEVMKEVSPSAYARVIRRN